MANGIYVATSGAVAQGTALDNVSNNLANASTTGYKGQRVAFASVLAAQEMQHTGVAAAKTDLQPGTMLPTDNPLDAAVDGEGFFAIETPQGTRYTRAGDFRLDAENKLVTAEGFAVRGEGGGAILVPPEAADVGIQPDGAVFADGVEVGRLELVRLDTASLQREGKNLFNGKIAEGEPVTLAVGALEGANVGVVRSMVDLIKVQRSYDALHRMIENYKQIDLRTARDLGGPK